jgi:hypothetical protein
MRRDLKEKSRGFRASKCRWTPRAESIGSDDMKGHIGDQNYDLGRDLDLAKYRAVSIWCKRFSVNFGAAALRPTETLQNN